MKRLITLILAIALCVPLYIPVQAEYRYDLMYTQFNLVRRNGRSWRRYRVK